MEFHIQTSIIPTCVPNVPEQKNKTNYKFLNGSKTKKKEN